MITGPLKGEIMKISFLVVLIIVIGLFIGWCMNIYKLTQCDFQPSYKAEAIRSIGIFVAPIGGVVGYMDIGK